MNIGRAIKTLRKELTPQLNQGEFADRIGVTQAYMSQIENGNKMPSMDVLQNISTFLDTPLPIMFWFGVEVYDISEDKREYFQFLKPSIDKLIQSIL